MAGPEVQGAGKTGRGTGAGGPGGSSPASTSQRAKPSIFLWFGAKGENKGEMFRTKVGREPMKANDLRGIDQAPAGTEVVNAQAASSRHVRT